jgi:hypothetical protein
MERKALALKFETDMPVIGQVMVLEAIDFIYTLKALDWVDAKTQWRIEGDWQRVVGQLPGKLLREEHFLLLHTARAGSVTEVVKGAAQPIAGTIEAILTYKAKIKKIEAEVRLMRVTEQEKEQEMLKRQLLMVREDLFPLIEKLKSYGVADSELNQLVVRAYQHASTVLAQLEKLGKVQISEERL